MRLLKQPGPVHPDRIAWFRGAPRSLRFALPAGTTLNEALTGPLVEAGFQSGALVCKDVALNPFRYVTPGPADDASHVAYFSAPRAPIGVSRIDQANAMFGWADGKPFVHCHAAWTEPDGRRRGGHILRRKRSSRNRQRRWRGDSKPSAFRWQPIEKRISLCSSRPARPFRAPAGSWPA